MQDIDEIEVNQQAEDLYEKKSFVIDAGQSPTRVDKWLQVRIENATRNKIQQAIEAGFLTVNGKIVKNNYKVKPGDELILMTEHNPDISDIVPENLNLNIIYEDADVMVVYKPSNMVVHPGLGNYSGTLLNGVAYHLMQQNPNLTEDDLPRYGLVHRIDKNTTNKTNKLSQDIKSANCLGVWSTCARLLLVPLVSSSVSGPRRAARRSGRRRPRGTEAVGQVHDGGAARRRWPG